MARATTLEFDSGPDEMRRAHGLMPECQDTVLNDVRFAVLEFNAIMAGQKGKKRTEAMVKHVRFSDVPGLYEFLGGLGDPLGTTIVGKLMHQFDQVRWHGLDRITDRLERRPAGRLVYIVVDTSVHSHVFAADNASQNDLRAVDRIFKCRFPHAQALLLLETDAVPIFSQSRGTLADAVWMERFAPNAVVWKNQVNIIAYLPFVPGYDDHSGTGSRPDFHHAVATVFRTRKDGKRSDFAGGNQVRALRLRMGTKNKKAKARYNGKSGDHMIINPDWKPDEPEFLPDVRKVTSYSLKGHYRAPDPRTPMMGFVDWLWITCRHLTMRSRRKEIGFRSDPMMYCPDCKDFFKLDHDNPHTCPPVAVVDEGFYDHVPNGGAVLSEVEERPSPGLDITDLPSIESIKVTNSASLTIWNQMADAARAVFTEMLASPRRIAFGIIGLFRKARSPPAIS